MLTHRTVRLDTHPGGIDLTITEAGAGGRPLMLLHGFTGARNDFCDWFEPLAEAGWHVVAPDHRGHGESHKPDDEAAYSFTILAGDAIALADSLGWDSFVLLGHSMGGMVAQEVALGWPARVRALILMDTSHTTLAVDADLVATAVSIARDQGMDLLAEVMAAHEDDLLATEADRRVKAERPGYIEHGDGNFRASSPAMYAALVAQITAGEIDRLDDLGSITVPTLVIVGEQDEPFIKPSRRMAEAIPDAHLAVIPDAGHSPQFESPDAWWAALSGFLGGLDGDSPAGEAGGPG